MPKHSVYLNDHAEDLYSSYKDQLNLSELLAGSIAYHTSKLQIIEEANPDVKEIVKRFLQEKDEDNLEGQKHGLQNGIAWAREVALLGDLENVVKNRHDALGDSFWENYQDFSVRIIHMDNLPESESWSSSWDDGYISGFIQGAESVWNKIEEHVA